MKKEIRTIFFMVVFLLIGNVRSEVNPWTELETQESQIKKMVVDLKDQIESLQKRLRGVLTTEERFVLQEELRIKQKEFINHQTELKKVQQQIQFRFPERGLLLNKSLSESIEFPVPESSKENSSVTSKPGPEIKKNKNLLEEKENSVDKAIESLRRQYGRPLEEEEKRELRNKSSDPKKQNPLEQKIILSK